MANTVCADENRFALVRERIMTRRNWEKITSETRELAALTNSELDDLERSLAFTPLTTAKTGKLGQAQRLLMMTNGYLIGSIWASAICMFIMMIPNNMYLHRSCLILAVVAASSFGGLRAGITSSAVSAAFMAAFLSASDSGRIIWIAMVFSIPSIVSSYHRIR